MLPHDEGLPHCWHSLTQSCYIDNGPANTRFIVYVCTMGIYAEQISSVIHITQVQSPTNGQKVIKDKACPDNVSDDEILAGHCRSLC